MAMNTAISASWIPFLLISGANGSKWRQQYAKPKPQVSVTAIGLTYSRLLLVRRVIDLMQRCMLPGVHGVHVPRPLFHRLSAFVRFCLELI